jgi:hypothetical protein
MGSWFCSPDKAPRIETFAEENSSKAIKRPNMGNIVIYGLCGEKRCAKGRQDKAVLGGAMVTAEGYIEKIRSLKNKRRA